MIVVVSLFVSRPSCRVVAVVRVVMMVPSHACVYLDGLVLCPNKLILAILMRPHEKMNRIGRISDETSHNPEASSCLSTGHEDSFISQTALSHRPVICKSGFF